MTDTLYSLTLCGQSSGLTVSPEYLEHIAKVRRVNGDGTRTTVWMGPIDQLGETLYEAERLCSYAATAKLTNTKTWMEGLAERINALLDKLNDPDRVRFLVTEFCCENKYREEIRNL
jgi:regulator of PEP synthase PpsR (kinase-PPPase family)